MIIVETEHGSEITTDAKIISCTRRSGNSNFKEKADMFSGVRMLRQDPVENLFCANALVKRISGNTDYYSFPMRPAQLQFRPSDHLT